MIVWSIIVRSVDFIKFMKIAFYNMFLYSLKYRQASRNWWDFFDYCLLRNKISNEKNYKKLFISKSKALKLSKVSNVYLFFKNQYHFKNVKKGKQKLFENTRDNSKFRKRNKNKAVQRTQIASETRFSKYGYTGNLFFFIQFCDCQNLSLGII